MLRTPQFYLLYAMLVMMATGGLLVTAQAGPMAQSWGLTVAALTLATSLSPVANGGSRVFWGWVSDKTGRELAMGVAFLMQAAALLLVLTILDRLSGTLFAVTLVLVFLTWGEVFSLFPSLLGDYYGTRHATSNYGVLYSAKGVASVICGRRRGDALRAVRELGCVLLRQRGARARGGSDGLQPARVGGLRGRGARWHARRSSPAGSSPAGPGATTSPLPARHRPASPAS